VREPRLRCLRRRRRVLAGHRSREVTRPRSGVTCVRSSRQGPLSANDAGIEGPVKVERPQRSEDVRP
jgi:hypothetical protein